jgi:hypothetical protein
MGEATGVGPGGKWLADARMTGTAGSCPDVLAVSRGAQATAVSLALHLGAVQLRHLPHAVVVFSSRSLQSMPIAGLFWWMVLAIGGGAAIWRQWRQPLPTGPSRAQPRRVGVDLQRYPLLTVDTGDVGGVVRWLVGRRSCWASLHNSALIPTGGAAAVALSPLTRWGGPPTPWQRK